MAEPSFFTWVEKPYLAALAKPRTEEELRWLRDNGIDVLISLTEDPPPRRLINQAGLMLVHLPITDFMPPTQEDLLAAIDAIQKAKDSGLGAAVHCGAGLGRTGSILAAWYVHIGYHSMEALRKVRAIRPGSIETPEQEEAIHLFARELKRGNGHSPNDDPETQRGM
jgi:atypical dual specificity phosphatase